MNLNLTLLGQMLTFILLVAFTMKYIWPYLMKAIDERQQKIADGLAAADRGKHELELAQHKASDILRDARINAATYVEQATKRAAHIVEEAKEQARVEADRILDMARNDIIIERNNAREAVRQEIAGLALQSAKKILGHHLTHETDEKLIQQFVTEVSSSD